LLLKAPSQLSLSKKYMSDLGLLTLALTL